MMPPVSRYLIEHMTPERRRELAAWNLDLSIYLTPPAVWATLAWPVVGMVILIVVSFYAITLTGYDALATADVRTEVDKT
jgi:hypothetical protein